MSSTGQARTILGPLTTTFTPAPACFTPVVECAPPSCDVGWQAQTCYSSSSDIASVEDNSDCWPPRSGSVTLSTHNPTLNGWGFYSPGLVCPSGYTSACTATGGGSWGWPVQFSLFVNPEETAIGCCPSDYSCTNIGAQTCISTVSSAVFSAVSCYSGTSGAVSSYTLPITTDTSTTNNAGEGIVATVTILSTYSILAPLIQINWQSSDLLATTTTPSSTNSLPSTTSASPTSTSQPPSGLSTGARAGLGVGISLGVLAVALLLFFLYRRNKHNYRPTGQDFPKTTEPSAHELEVENNVYEMPNTEEVQRGVPGRISELDG